jgi:hypothetical protein
MVPDASSSDPLVQRFLSPVYKKEQARPERPARESRLREASSWFPHPTPVGDYNPDWAITFKKGSVKHVYFVAETKGTMSSLKLREIEKTKIACAKKFFDEIGKRISQDRVRYDVVTSYEKLMDVVGRGAAAA